MFKSRGKRARMFKISSLTCRGADLLLRVMEATKASQLGTVVVVVVLYLWVHSIASGSTNSEYTRDDFPADFVFGAATSSFQYEGGKKEDGRTPGIMDTIWIEGDVSPIGKAADGYHKYKEDIKLMSETGLQGYRFSISWSRILPNGRGKVNPKGIQYYNSVIDELIKHGIQPHVTIFHFDFPQVLQDEYKGWLNPKVVDDFSKLADVCFREFGDRVSHWTTLNEPIFVALLGYDYGISPPHRCSTPFGDSCGGGNSTTEPYIVAHHMILAHSAAVELYKKKYQAIQKGKIGITLFITWFNPLTDSTEDKFAAQRAMDFVLGWFMNPLVFGDYSESMKKIADSRIPSLTESQSQQLKGAFDFIGVNYYYPLFVSDNLAALDSPIRDAGRDMLVKFTGYKDQTPIDLMLAPFPYPIHTDGLVKALQYIRDKYANPAVYIHENGYGAYGKDGLKEDEDRISYLREHIGSTLHALREGSDVRGYFVWSFVDVVEMWGEVFYGLFRVDFNKDCKRSPNPSAIWYASFLRNGSVVSLDAKIE